MEQTYITLNDGNKIPQFGLGVFLIPEDEKAKEACLEAFKLGYRHIDTAHAYHNERGIGQAVKESGLPREEIWITSTSCCCINNSVITWVLGKTWKKQSLKAKSRASA